MPSNPPVSYSILLVEDDQEIGELLKVLLERQGFIVAWCTNGLECLERFKDKQFSLIILDVMLPGLDGYELCRRIRSQEKDTHVPIIMLSALAQKGEIDQGLIAGADRYIKKPYQNDYLLSQIKSLLGIP